MGTRGLWGFRKNGVDKLTYNHYDSYPDYLGYKIINFIQQHDLEELVSIYNRIVLVDEEQPATAEAMVLCKKFSDVDVSTKSIRDWYCLLRRAQGCPEVYANGLRFMIDSADFIKNSLFCEFAYIINLDDNVLEFWVGFQHKPDKTNRYGNVKLDGHYPCKMLKAFNLNDIKKMNSDDIIKEMIVMNDIDYQDQTQKEDE